MASNRINPKVLGATFAAFSLILSIAGYVWHAVLQQPSIMNLLYPRFWSDITLVFQLFAGGVLASFILGYVFALVYNWFDKKIRQ